MSIRPVLLLCVCKKAVRYILTVALLKDLKSPNDLVNLRPRFATLATCGGSCLDGGEVAKLRGRMAGFPWTEPWALLGNLIHLDLK